MTTKQKLICTKCNKKRLSHRKITCGHDAADYIPFIKEEKQSKKQPQEDLAIVFLDQKGETIKVKDIISENETWLLERRNEPSKRILSHSAIQKIAQVSGIASNYVVEESSHIIPRPENSMLHVVGVTIKCLAIKNIQTKEGCVHDMFENFLTMTGEASKINTGRGKEYLRTMAEKRGYDRSVLKHVGMTGVYSEEEAAAFESEETKQKIDVISTDDLEIIAPLVNDILNVKSIEELEKVGTKIAEQKEKLNENQIQFLRERYATTHNKFSQKF